MPPWQDPPWTSVEFTGRSAELRTFGLLGEDAWGVDEGTGCLGPIVTGT